MHRYQYRPSQKSGRGGSSLRGSRGTFRRGPRRIKRLDPRLFIHKPTNDGTYLESLVEQVHTRFSDFAIHERLKNNIKDHGYVTPTPIQEKAIPEIISGRDVIGIANTGTGKTAAFLISLLNKTMQDRNQRVLIVVPTRELAIQIRDEFYMFSKDTGIQVLAAIGGGSMGRQLYQLSRNPNFVIGTPGRLKDLTKRGALSLQFFQNVVLDEVDRMVDIGFIHDMKYLISCLPRERQSLFFSATVDGKTQDVLKSFVTNPVTISVKQQNTPSHIEQDVVKVDRSKSKIDILHELLIQPGFDKVLIFGRTKWGMEKLSRELDARGFQTGAIHGNKSQNQRLRILDAFKSNRVKILVATDVAARGLDIENVTHVINFDAPESYEDYVHRIGRTGRAGKKGMALTFVE